jgi:GT2 family glycosyltransferase
MSSNSTTQIDEYEISVIIPTYDRPDQFRRCLDALAEQNHLPAEVIIVDDGRNHPINPSMVRDRLSNDVRVKILSSDGPAGIATARNTGAEAATAPIVLFLDDDVTLGESYIRQLKKLYETHDGSRLAGIGGYDDNLREPSSFERLYERIFYLCAGGWRINDVGIRSWDKVSKVTEAEWLPGYNGSYKRSVILEHSFIHWEGGRETLEDVAAGWWLKQEGYHCLIAPQLRLNHKETGIPSSNYQFGLQRGRNRIRIFLEFGRLSRLPVFIWAYAGDTLRQFLSPLFDNNWQSHFETGTGMAVAPLSYLIGSVVSILLLILVLHQS